MPMEIHRVGCNFHINTLVYISICAGLHVQWVDNAPGDGTRELFNSLGIWHFKLMGELPPRLHWLYWLHLYWLQLECKQFNFAVLISVYIINTSASCSYSCQNELLKRSKKKKKTTTWIISILFGNLSKNLLYSYGVWQLNQICLKDPKSKVFKINIPNFMSFHSLFPLSATFLRI